MMITITLSVSSHLIAFNIWQVTIFFLTTLTVIIPILRFDTYIEKHSAM